MNNKFAAHILNALALCILFQTHVEAGAFSTTGEMVVPRSGQTATLLTNGLVLIAGGRDSSTFQETAAAELYDPTTGTWTATGSMSTPRLNHTATLLPDGEVLVAGGTGTNFAAPYFGVLTNAEIYNPATGIWTPTGPLKVARRSHTASLLANGKVLVAGGTYNESGMAELYDPAAGTWTLTGSMTTNRQEHTATVLTNGLVLVAGGEVNTSTFNTEPTASAELYNPTNGTWTATGSMTTNRYGQLAILLKDGQVLVVANNNANTTLDGDTSTELYNPISGTWTNTGSMKVTRDQAAATLLPDGQVLVTGGGSGYPTPRAEIYNPFTRQWTVAGSLVSNRSAQTATLLPDGMVLLAGGGGYGSTSAELYNPNTAWQATGSLNVGRISGYTLTTLTNGQVLIAGGGGYTGVEAGAEVYTPTNGTWLITGDMTTPRKYQTATLLPNGQVLVTGGEDDEGNVLSSAELFDPVSGSWTETGEMNSSREHHTATLLKNGKVLVAGGGNNISSCELYDPITGTWSATGSLQSPQWYQAAVLLSDGQVLVAGGTHNGAISSAELYDSNAGTWTLTDSMSVNLSQPVATLLPNGKVLVSGSYANLVTEIYDPSNGHWTTGATTTNRQNFSATLLSDGKVLFVGGDGASTALSSGAQLYDPASDTWTNTFGPMTSGRSQQRAVLLPDGKILVAGGDADFTGTNLAITAEIFDPAAGTTPAIVLVPSGMISGGSFGFDFTGTPGQQFTVWSTADVSAPFSSWTSLGAVTETSPGHYQFSDSQAANLAHRYYRVTSP